MYNSSQCVKVLPQNIWAFLLQSVQSHNSIFLPEKQNSTKQTLLQVGWIKADTKAIQAIGKHVISNNQRITVSHDPTRSKFRLHITGVTLEDAGPYMCQINSLPVKAQVSK